MFSSCLCVCVSVCLSMCVCVCVCLSVCLSVCSGYNFWTSWHRNFIFGMALHLDHIKVKFEYQGHWVKVKVISWKMPVLLPGHQFNLVWLVWGQGHKLGQGHLKVRSFQSQIVSVWLSIGKWEVGLRLKGILVDSSIGNVPRP